MIDRRNAIAGIVLSASALVGIIMHEGYSDTAIIPVPGDVATIGFGTTGGVKMGDRITPPKAVARALTDIQKFEGAVKQCVKVPLTQYEYDSAISISYNIGTTAFCNSTMVKKLNAGDYQGFCDGMLQWNKFKGQPLRGLTLRRQRERAVCLGLVS